MTEEATDTSNTPAKTIWHPILRTCREEIAAACRNDKSDWGLSAIDGEMLAEVVEGSPESTIAEIALKVGDCLLEGGDYWSALPSSAERVLAKPEGRRPGGPRSSP